MPEEGQSNDTVKFSLVGKNIKHKFGKGEKHDWYDGYVVSQVLKPQFTPNMLQLLLVQIQQTGFSVSFFLLWRCYGNIYNRGRDFSSLHSY